MRLDGPNLRETSMTRLVALALAVVLTGCAGTGQTETPTKAASPTQAATPSGLPSVAPVVAGRKKPSDRSAVAFADGVILTFYYSISVRSVEALEALVSEPSTCTGCKDTAAAIAKLKSQRRYQLPGEITIKSASVTGRQDPQVIVTSVAKVQAGTWFDETDSGTGVLAAQRTKFTLLLAWDKATKTWHLQDYTVKG